jgi:aminopeptidase N
MPLAALGSNNIYPKGALVLEMLKRYLGPERFWASIHTYLERHALDNATSDDLRQAVLEATGENLDRFWQEWVYQAGYPQFDVAATYDTAGHTLTLHIRQTQQDTLKPDSAGLKFTVPPVFHMPVTVRVGTAQGDVTQEVGLDAREQTVTIANVATPPTMVIFDDGNRVLKSLHFEQPTAWLATQLARDPDLWDREWAIGQLAGRTADSAAARALAGAVRGADYYRTRARAAEALDSFPAALALPALEAALRDTSAAVRRAAVGALADIGGERAIALARRALADDPSYEVRAAAVTALAQADSAHAREVIAAALNEPSYQDAIQNAALGAIATTNDTSFIGAVDSLSATKQDPAFILAVLGAHGSARALELLARNLDDSRAAVRRWALQGFRYAMPRPMALAHLRGAVDRLTHADAQQAVREAIQQLSAPRGGS